MARKRRRGGQASNNRRSRQTVTPKTAENANCETSNEDCSDNSSGSVINENTSSEKTSSEGGKTVTEGIHKKFGKFCCIIDQTAKAQDSIKNEDRVTIEDVSDSEETSPNGEGNTFLNEQIYTVEEETRDCHKQTMSNEENVQIVSIEDSSLSSDHSNTVYVTIEQDDRNIDMLQETSREQVLEIVQGNIFKNAKVEVHKSSREQDENADNIQKHKNDKQDGNQNSQNFEETSVVYVQEEMQYSEEIENVETESLKIANKLSALNVNSDYIVEYGTDLVNNSSSEDVNNALMCEDSQKSNEVVFENLESELMIECVSEEVISADQELEDGIAREINIQEVPLPNDDIDSKDSEVITLENQEDEEMEEHPLFKETEIIEDNDMSDDEESLEDHTSEDIDENVGAVCDEEEEEEGEDEEERDDLIENNQRTEDISKTSKQKASPKSNKKLGRPKKTEKKVQKSNKIVKEPKKKKTPEKKITESQEKSENIEVRRSNRIRSIKTRQKQKVNTSAKTKTTTKSKKASADIDTSENSNSGNTDSDKMSSDSSNFAVPPANDSEQKPVKVKSRWRRSSELEMGSRVDENSNSTKETEKMTPEEEIKMRLKQFIHLKDNTYLTDRVCCKEAKKMVCDCFLTPEEIDRGEFGCGEDCLNRLLMIECGPLCPLGDKCTNKRFQKTKTSPCEVFRTEKKGLGIRATRTILDGEFILEYVGEVIDSDEFENRATEYSKGKNPHFYFMALRSDAVIDATQKGNISRFINHSCEPNAETQKWTVNGELRIGFFSKKTIQVGDEITFDYHFQRYGKEAQKCYCEAPSCRGWLGEEPEEDDEEEEEVEEEDVEEEEEEEEEEEVEEEADEEKQEIVNEKLVDKIKEEIETEKGEDTVIKDEVIKEEAVQESVEGIKKEINEVTIKEKPKPKSEKVKKVVKKEKASKNKPIKILQKTRKELFDDPDVNQEIQMLMTTGLKNQVHTLKLSRLMVRATETLQKSNLLRVLRRGEFPCRRLFLDYHGLRLIHGWMTEAQKNCKTDLKQESLRLEILQTLATLPIPNKTMLQDSKVLLTVEKWSTPLKNEDVLDSDSNSPKLEEKDEDDLDNEEGSSKKETKTIQVNEEEKAEEIKNENENGDVEDCEFRKSVGMDFENIVKIQDQKLSKIILNATIADFANMFEDDIASLAEKVKEIKTEEPDYEVEIVALALKLLEEWSSLKEVFRIPKKERIERMKEHEREANRGYKAALEHELERKRSNRYRHMQRHSSKFESIERIRKPYPILDHKSTSPKFNKHERRKLFALQVEQEEEEKRRKIQAFVKQEVAVLPVDVRYGPSHDVKYQYMWNPQTCQWQKVQILNQSPQNPTNINPSPLPNLNQNPHNLTRGLQSLGHNPANLNINPQNTNPNHPSILSHNLPPNLNQSATNFNTVAPRLPYPFSSYSSNMNPSPHPQAPSPVPSFANLQSVQRVPHAQLPNVSHMSQFSNIVQTNTVPNVTPPMQQAPRPPHPVLQHANLSVTSIPLPSSNNPPLPNVPPLPTSHPLPNAPPLPASHSSSIVPPLPTSHSTSNVPPLPTSHSLSNLNFSTVFNLPTTLVEEKKEDLSQVRFAGPIPPPVKLPPKWKCAKDKYGRPYYYHIKIRISQWEPPEFPPPVEESEDESLDTTSSSESSSVSSDSSSEGSDSDEDDVDDTRLMIEIKRNLKNMESNLTPAKSSGTQSPDEDVESKDSSVNETHFEKKPSLEERLKEEFNLMKGDNEPPVKRRRSGLVTEVHIISPRTEEDKILAKENLKRYKDNKEKLKRQKEKLRELRDQPVTEQPKKRIRVTIKNTKHKRHKEREKTKEVDSETARKIKETFRSSMASVMVGILNPYRKSDCKEGHISNNEDFKHLARKLTHFVMLKELKHCKSIEDLTCTDSVKSKAKEFVRKYMSKFGEVYVRPKDEMDF